MRWPLSEGIAVLVMLIGAVVVGSAMMMTARFARRSFPRCRQCRYNLTGLPSTRAQCPECGTELDDNLRLGGSVISHDQLPPAWRIVRETGYAFTLIGAILTSLFAVPHLLAFLAALVHPWFS